MNKSIFMGRLTSTPELKHTKDGIAVCTFVLAVDRPNSKNKEKETDWLTIVAWRNKAEFVSKYLTKGRKVLITATARTRTYEDKDGNNHKITEFIADDIEFCDKKPYGETQEECNQQLSTPAEGLVECDPNEDLPF